MPHRAHRPRKRFGQNFLHDPGIIRRIVAAIAPAAGDHLVEIGPGQGAITGPLLASGARLDLIELDRDLATALRTRWPDQPGLRILQADALRTDLCGLAGDDQPLRVVGNLPYNISTPLVFHLLEQLHCIRDIHVMLQREVVERMAAAPGSRDYGRLSVMVQYHCRVEPLFHIGPGAFRPQPRVESAFVRLRPHPVPPVTVTDPACLARVLRTAFSHRRKTLRNALRGLLDEDRIRRAGIDPGARPETLDLAAFAALAEAIDTQRP